MLEILALFNVFIALIAFLVGLVLIINPRRDTQRTSFSLLTFSTAIWVLSNFFGSHTTGLISYYLILIDFISGLILVSLFWLFSNYTKREIIRSEPSTRKSIVPILFGAWTAILTVLIVIGEIVVINTEPELQIINQPLYILYPMTVFVFAAFAIKNLVVAQRKSNDQKYTHQIKLIYIALLCALVFVSVPNLILENILERDDLLLLSYNFSYLGILLFLLITSYAVFRQGFLDVRYIVFRLIGYVLSLVIVLSVYILLTNLLTSSLLQIEFIKNNLQLYYICIAAIMALTFSPIKRRIDKLTNKLFLREKYSLHEALNQISTYTTRSVDTKKIESYTLSIINETIRPEYSVFVIFDKNSNLKITSHSGPAPLDIFSMQDFMKKLDTLKHKSTIVNDLSFESPMKNYFDLAHISVITHLSTYNKSIGYLITGDKQNGSNYDAYDLQLLTLTSNDLALALQNAQRYEEIKAFNLTLQNKVNEATKALKRTNTKLIALDDAKDEFISMASHQLRTPLTSIKGYISMLLEEDLGKLNKTQKQALKEAFDSSQRMVFLISDFLNVSRIRTGKFIIEPSKTDIGRIVDEEIAQLRDMAKLRGQKITYKPPKKLPTLLLDENKIRQVMMNMLDNAIYYTPRNGEITIILEKDDDTITYKVIDTGIGVPLKEQHSLFTKFFRAKNARNARPDGTGLGLFMAQKIITAQGGKIIFKSEEGKGSTFGFSFPCNKSFSSVDKSESGTV